MSQHSILFLAYLKNVYDIFVELAMTLQKNSNIAVVTSAFANQMSVAK